jgi:hypothetical protein
MSHQEEKYPITALPDQLLDDVERVIHSYSTALIMITMGSGGQECIRLVGSGTFVSVFKTFGILTAAHVVDLLKGPYSLGLTLTDHAQKYAIDSQHLEVIRIAKGQVDSEGPDLGFIVLPPSELGTIRARKTFHNLDRNRDRMLTTPPELDKGIWALCGVPDVQTTEEPSEKGFDSLKGFHELCGFGGIRSIYMIGEYDYCDFGVKYDSSPNIPEKFGGVSGGGLWQIPLVKSSEGRIEPKEYILSGVAFYETGRTGLYQLIKCHGRNSIYNVAYQKVIGSNS